VQRVDLTPACHVATKIDSLLVLRVEYRRKVTCGCDCVAAPGLLEPTRADDVKPDDAVLSQTGEDVYEDGARTVCRKKHATLASSRIDADVETVVDNGLRTGREGRGRQTEREAEHTPKPGERA